MHIPDFCNFRYRRFWNTWPATIFFSCAGCITLCRQSLAFNIWVRNRFHQFWISLAMDRQSSGSPLVDNRKHDAGLQLRFLHVLSSLNGFLLFFNWPFVSIKFLDLHCLTCDKHVKTAQDSGLQAIKVGFVSSLIIQLHKTLGGWKDKYKKLTASLTQMLIMG